MHFINIIEYELVQRKIKGRETVLEAGKVGMFLFIADKTIWKRAVPVGGGSAMERPSAQAIAPAHGRSGFKPEKTSQL